MVDLQWMETLCRDDHGDDLRIDALARIDNAIESAILIVPWLIWFHERRREVAEIQVWLAGMEQEIILNLLDVLWFVLKADESRK